MGNEQSSSESSEGGWGLQCAALGMDADSSHEKSSGFSLLSCACTALGPDDGTEDDIVFKSPVDHREEQPRSRALRSSQRQEEFSTTQESPMTFEEATGATRLDAARRSRAQEVKESEANFLREFQNMMTTGLTVQFRQSPEHLMPVHLLMQGSAIEWHYRDVNGEPMDGKLDLDNVSLVQGNPDPATLGFDLAARSFVVINHQGHSHLFHTDSKDVCSLLVDGLVMLVKRTKKTVKKKRPLQQRNNSLKDIQNHLP